MHTNSQQPISWSDKFMHSSSRGCMCHT